MQFNLVRIFFFLFLNRRAGCYHKCYQIKTCNRAWTTTLCLVNCGAVVCNQRECVLCQFSGGKRSEVAATWAKANVIGSGFLNPDPA